MAERHSVCRGGIVRALENDARLEVAGECADGREALYMIRDRRPDVAILGVTLPSLGGAELLHAVAGRETLTRVMMVAMSADHGQLYAAVSNGATGFLSFDASPDDISDVVTAAAEGKASLSPDLYEGLLNEIHAHAQLERPLLSDRETTILRLAAGGASNEDIAQEMNLSPATVKSHLRSASDKLGASNRTEAAVAAARHGLI